MKAPDWVHEMADQVWADFLAAREKFAQLPAARKRGESRTMGQAFAFRPAEGNLPRGCSNTEFRLLMEELR